MLFRSAKKVDRNAPPMNEGQPIRRVKRKGPQMVRELPGNEDNLAWPSEIKAPPPVLLATFEEAPPAKGDALRQAAAKRGHVAVRKPMTLKRPQAVAETKPPTIQLEELLSGKKLPLAILASEVLSHPRSKRRFNLKH
jgi:hypothetical protein